METTLNRTSIHFTTHVHEQLRLRLKPGQWVVDATAGNGHDTLFLAQSVAPSGKVIAIDVQATALAATSERLAQHGLADHVQLRLGSHADWEAHVPPSWKGQLAGVMFNCGYLPGSNALSRTQITRSPSTLAAVQQACAWLQPEGWLSIMTYSKHPGGQEEQQALLDWSRSLQASGSFEVNHQQASKHPTAPVWIWAQQH